MKNTFKTKVGSFATAKLQANSRRLLAGLVPLALAAAMALSLMSLSLTGCDNGGYPGGDPYYPPGNSLPAPTLTATATSSSEIWLSWTAVSGASGYSVYRSTSSSSGFQILTSTQSTSTTSGGLSANTTYYYQVAAYNSSAEGSRSNTASARTAGFSTVDLDGTWTTTHGGGYSFRVTGDSGVLTWVSPSFLLYTDGVNKGYLVINGPYFRRLRNTAELTWTGEVRGVSYSGDTAHAETWTSVTLSLSADGSTLSWYAPGFTTSNRTFTRTY